MYQYNYLRIYSLFFLLFISKLVFGSFLLIPMDNSQTNHLKAYGVAFFALEENIKVDWLLNYQGGSFLIANNKKIKEECLIRNVLVKVIAVSQAENIKRSISSNEVNQEIIGLEKAPKVAIYSPKNKHQS